MAITSCEMDNVNQLLDRADGRAFGWAFIGRRRQKVTMIMIFHHLRPLTINDDSSSYSQVIFFIVIHMCIYWLPEFLLPSST